MNILTRVIIICIFLSSCKTNTIIKNVYDGYISNGYLYDNKSYEDDGYAYIDSMKINPVTFNNGWKSLPSNAALRTTLQEGCVLISKPSATTSRMYFKSACPSFFPDNFLIPQGCDLTTNENSNLQQTTNYKKVKNYYLKCNKEGADIAEKELGIIIGDEQKEVDRENGVGLDISQQRRKDGIKIKTINKGYFQID